VEGLWDGLRIEAVVANLLTNAIKFGSGKPVEIVVTRDQGQALVTVTDHGIGINTQDREKLFQRFERAIATREYGGFGLGLWICRNIVEASGGTIDVMSEPGKGSTFTVRLPLGQGDAALVAP
jgi:signal transduction histidine kinase